MIRLHDIAFRQGRFGLSDVNLTIPTGAYAVLMGPTGCGKTTLLELICGLRRPERGSIHIGGIDVTTLPPGARGIGYVPQDGALFATMSVSDQLSFAWRVRGVPAAERRRRAAELAGPLGLTALLDRQPEHLSGGERQRVALGRALACEPAVLLLDEPLSSLDESTQDELRLLLCAVHQRTGATILHVTHATREADALATCRLTMQRDGQLRNE